MTDQGGSALRHVLDRVETIVFDELQPGEQLPSEGALALELGVSRLTVREAIKQLSARGLVETHNGRKPVAAIPNGRGVGDYFRSAIRRDPHALFELLDVRLALETHNASLAAANASRTSIQAMQAAVDEMDRQMDDAEKFTDADIHFHELLALATGNQMLATLIEELSGCLRASQAQTVTGHARRGYDLKDSVAQHRAILEKVAERDASGAAAAMRRHLRTARKDLVASM